MRLRRTAPGELDGEVLRPAWRAIGALIDYPTPELLLSVDRIDALVAGLPSAVREPLNRLTAHLRRLDIGELQRAYVETFDHTRKCSLYLTYFAHGDTRKRGVALVQFKQVYRRFGLELNDEELPDHLSVVCEFGASGDLAAAWRLLTDHRASIEVLRLALIERGSPWQDALIALSATLPSLGKDESTAIARLIEAGPPSEEVGLAPYALDPTLDEGPPLPQSPAFLGLPDRVGATK